jgi:signal transduction histidine kinase
MEHAGGRELDAIAAGARHGDGSFDGGRVMPSAPIAEERAAGTMPLAAHGSGAGEAGAARPVPADTAPPAGCEALAALGDAVAVLDRRGRRLLWASRAWLALQPELVAGTTFDALETALPGFVAAIGAATGTGAPAQRVVLGAAQQWEAQFTSPGNGATTRVLVRLADRRETTRALQRQLDDREQLLFTSRVISVGEMATTLAHELNQPIGATANLLRGLRSRLARRSSALSAEEAGALDRAIDQVMFAARVITRIREFTHTHQPRHVRVDLAALLRSSASLLDWDLRRTGARLTLDLPAGEAGDGVESTDVAVRGDEVMLQQVIVNLMRNALDALRSDPPADPHVVLRLVPRAGEFEIQVCDNGCGLGDEVAARLFVPFASTKPSGMGIGLSICRSFVELHQGRLWFSRNPDRGATFHIGLPRLTARSETSAS